MSPRKVVVHIFLRFCPIALLKSLKLFNVRQILSTNQLSVITLNNSFQREDSVNFLINLFIFRHQNGNSSENGLYSEAEINGSTRQTTDLCFGFSAVKCSQWNQWNEHMITRQNNSKKFSRPENC